jgi:EmrB/QacA subfamily drug resistance transporter
VPTVDTQPEVTGSPRQVPTLVATALGLFMIKLDATVVNVALPDLQAQFRVGEQGLQWVVAAYSLTMGMFVMAGAAFADRRGRRLAYLSGLLVFVAASIACGLAPSVPLLGVARGVQGVGAAVISVASLALLVSAYQGSNAKAKAIGAWTGISAVGYAIGPTVGGILTGAFGWRSIFLVNPVVGAVAVVLTLRFVAESRDPQRRPFDLAGQALFVVAIGLVTYVLVEGPHVGWLSPPMLVLGAAGLAATTAFVVVERRRPEPMMDLGLFGDRVYSVAIYTIFSVMFCVYGTLLIVTQYFQNVRGHGPTLTGVLMISMTAPSIVAAPLAGRMVGRYGARLPTLLGVGSICIGTALLVVSTGGPIVWTLLGLSLTGVAGSLAVAPATAIAMRAVPEARSGMASGIISVQRALGSTAGFAIMGSILAAGVSLALPGALAPDLPDRAERDRVVEVIVEDANPRAVTSLIGPGRPLPREVDRDDRLVDAADEAFVTGLRAAWGLGFLAVAVAFVAGWAVFPRGRSSD